MKVIYDVRYDLYRVNSSYGTNNKNKAEEVKIGKNTKTFDEIFSDKLVDKKDQYPNQITNSKNKDESYFKASVSLNSNEKKEEKEEIKISHHAEKRLRERGILLDDQGINILLKAMDELKEKGARDSLVITSNLAFLVNIPNKTLITAMRLEELKERVFTQIDSVSIR